MTQHRHTHTHVSTFSRTDTHAPGLCRPQIFRLMRTLVELCGTLEDVPEERHIFMRLTYHVSAVQ